ncbi:MAG: LPS export ABC transporter periplasmic protein LptC [Wenzhouxiangellaceae bacterium]|nr:LPS export ABC transporter periplasmic protein LptC [Wenzhouxiangellaceae bacterium]
MRRRTGALRALLALAALALLAVVNWWLLRSPAPVPSMARPDQQRIDYALADFHGRFFNQDGGLTLDVRGPSLRHDARTRTAEIDNPRFVLTAAGNTWQGASERAHIERDADQLVLVGNVELSSPQARGLLQVTTEHLVFKRELQQLHAPVPARIEQGGNELMGGTLTIWLNDERLELGNDVHAILRDDAGAGNSESGKRADRAGHGR